MSAALILSKESRKDSGVLRDFRDGLDDSSCRLHSTEICDNDGNDDVVDDDDDDDDDDGTQQDYETK